MVCENVRDQEYFHNEVANWVPGALFFPAVDAALAGGSLIDPEITAERLEVLQRLLKGGDAGLVAVCAGSLDDDVPAPESLAQTTVELKTSARLDRDQLIESLAKAGYERVGQVSARGQIAVRGGILDIFSWQHSNPVRIEFFDDTIESIRPFDVDSQTSVESSDRCSLLIGEADSKTCLMREYIRPEDLVIASSTDLISPRVLILEGVGEASASPKSEVYDTAFHDHGLGEFEAGDLVIAESRREELFRQLREWRNQKWSTYIYCNNEGEAERLHDLLPEEERDHVRYPIGSVSKGFTFPCGPSRGPLRCGAFRPLPQHPRAADGAAAGARPGEPRRRSISAN